MIYLLQKFMLGLLEMAILWLAYAIFIKYIVQNRQNKLRNHEYQVNSQGYITVGFNTSSDTVYL